MRLVRDVSLEIQPGEVHALVGESGSGKTTIARAIIGLLPDGITATAGSIRFAGRDLARLDEPARRALRGAAIGMIFQEPLVSLNPSMKIGAQMIEAMRLHTGKPRAEIREAAIEMLEAAASVLAELPTTALDAIVQREVLDIMRDMSARFGVSVLLVTHDLGVVARYVDRVIVMCRGEVVEGGTTAEVLSAPRQDYTRNLLAALPQPPQGQPAGPAGGTPLIEARELSIVYEKPAPFPFMPRRRETVVHQMSLALHPGEMLGLVGESGSGKSTFGRALIRLKDVAGGGIFWPGRDITTFSGDALRRLRPKMQIVSQDPFSSLNPRFWVWQIIAEDLRMLEEPAPAWWVDEMLEAVGLSSDFRDRFPHQLSGDSASAWPSHGPWSPVPSWWWRMSRSPRWM